MSDHHLNTIESAIAHHERQIQDLNDVIIRQAKDIELLKKQISRMYDKINVLGDQTADEGGENLSISEQAARDKPPHY